VSAQVIPATDIMHSYPATIHDILLPPFHSQIVGTASQILSELSDSPTCESPRSSLAEAQQRQGKKLQGQKTKVVLHRTSSRFLICSV